MSCRNKEGGRGQSRRGVEGADGRRTNELDRFLLSISLVDDSDGDLGLLSSNLVFCRTVEDGVDVGRLAGGGRKRAGERGGRSAKGRRGG